MCIRDRLIVDLDGTAGLGTSFLEESFGGLIRRDHINYNILKQTPVSYTHLLWKVLLFRKFVRDDNLWF